MNTPQEDARKPQETWTERVERELEEWNRQHPDKKKRDIFCRGECWQHEFRCPFNPACNE